MPTISNKQNTEKRDLLIAKLASDEEIRAEATFSAFPDMFIILGTSVAVLILGAILLTKITVAGMLLNFLGMIIAYEASNQLLHARSSCILVTNKRIFGQNGPREVEVPLKRIKECKVNKRSISLSDNNGDILIKHLSNAAEISRTIKAR